MTVHSEHLSDPGVELRESGTQGETVAEEKVRRTKVPYIQQKFGIASNMYLALKIIHFKSIMCSKECKHFFRAVVLSVHQYPYEDVGQRASVSNRQCLNSPCASNNTHTYTHKSNHQKHEVSNND